MARYKVMTERNSAVVALSMRFRDENGIRPGDKVEIWFPSSSLMTVEPARNELDAQQDDLDTLLAFRGLIAFLLAHAPGDVGALGGDCLVAALVHPLPPLRAARALHVIEPAMEVGE